MARLARWYETHLYLTLTELGPEKTKFDQIGVYACNTLINMDSYQLS